MNSACLILTSALLAGHGDAPVAAAAPAGPAVISSGASCSNCGGGAAIADWGGCGCDAGCSKPSLFDRIRARFHKDCCAPACDTCSAPAPVVHHHHPVVTHQACCEPTACPAPCDTGCGHSWGGGGLFAKLRAKFSHSSSCDTGCGCDSGCSSCSSGGVIGAPIAGAPISGAPISSAPTYGAPISSTPGAIPAAPATALPAAPATIIPAPPAIPSKPAEPIPAPKDGDKKEGKIGALFPTPSVTPVAAPKAFDLSAPKSPF